MDIKTSNGELKTHRVHLPSIVVGITVGLIMATTFWAMKLNKPVQVIEPVPITPQQIADLVELMCTDGVTVDVIYTAYSPKISCFVNRVKK